MYTLPFPALPPTARSLAPQNFDALISTNGQRVAWCRSRTCPCILGGGGANGRLPELGSPQRNCTQCFGVGIYWDAPSLPFQAYIEFMHMSPTPDEPGVKMNDTYGAVQMSEPSMTIPFRNPNLADSDGAQPTNAWTNATVNDKFIPVDMISRYTAALQVGVKENLPFQQALVIAPTGAVTIWNPSTAAVVPVTGYAVSGATVTISGYPKGTNYMVEFQAAPVFVAFRTAGGLPHVRPFGGGSVNEPRRMRLQALDFWTRQRNLEPQASTVKTGIQGGGSYGLLTGTPVG
jgi:hypothetical protein